MITSVLIGAGQRGAQVYAEYARLHPDEIKFVAGGQNRTMREGNCLQRHINCGKQKFLPIGRGYLKRGSWRIAVWYVRRTAFMQSL